MLITTLLAGYLAAAVSADSQLVIVVENLKPAEGYVMIGLYDSSQAYRSERRLRSERVAVTSGRVSLTLGGLAPGDYALKLFHDIDGDTKLDTNLLGIPVEPVAFSNNARGKIGVPSWNKARFTLTAPATTQTIRFPPR